MLSKGLKCSGYRFIEGLEDLAKDYKDFLRIRRNLRIRRFIAEEGLEILNSLSKDATITTLYQEIKIVQKY